MLRIRRFRKRDDGMAWHAGDIIQLKIRARKCREARDATMGKSRSHLQYWRLTAVVVLDMAKCCSLANEPAFFRSYWQYGERVVATHM